ncbi:serine hydrolase domain-containing protein [Qipengyuania sp. R86523]|uniref:serine hydrolase domain-containing protein n=1 Tax=Qipengyuania sp. R86523 TaxID=3093862 RepID=UPI0037CB56CD
MRTLFVLSTFALVLSSASAQQPVVVQKADTAAISKFDDFLATFRKEKSIPSLSVIVLQDGVPIFEKAYGWSDDEGDTPTTLDTTYSIASVTKPITAAAIIIEAQADALDLALPMRKDEGWADICEWLSDSEILFGRGGMEDDGTFIPPMNCERETTLSDMLNMRANGDGSTFVYNPIGYARIDRAISGGGGRDLREIVRERIMDRAAIQNIALGWRDPQGGSALRLLALPFTVENGRRVRTAVGDDDFRAAAGIKASARHLATFDQALEQGTLLTADWYARIFEAPVELEAGDYRWGWFVQDWEDHRLAWHSGWDPGRYSAMYLKVPERGLTLIALANTEAIWWGNSAARAEIETSSLAREFLERFVH